MDTTKHTTNRILHVTADIGKSAVISLEEVNTDEPGVCVNLMDDILTGRRARLPCGAETKFN